MIGKKKMAKIPPRQGVRDNLSASDAVRLAQASNRDHLDVIESAFNSPYFRVALANVLDDFVHKVAAAVPEGAGPTGHKRSREGGYSGRFVGASSKSSAKIEERSRQQAAKDRAAAGNRDASRASVHFDNYTIEELQEELHRVGEEMAEIAVTRKGLDYVLLPNLRREIDHLAHVEGSMKKGLLRKTLTSNSLTGNLARKFYGHKDRLKAEAKEKISLDKQLDRMDKRLSTISESIMERAQKEDAERSSNDHITGDVVHGQEHNNKLLKKLLGLEASGSPEASLLGKDTLSAASGSRGILTSATALLTTPAFLTAVGIALVAVLTAVVVKQLHDAFKEQKKSDQEDAFKKADALGRRPENQGMSKSELAKSGAVQSLAEKTGQYKKDLSPNAEKTWKTGRLQELRATPEWVGKSDKEINAQVDKEWAVYAISEAPASSAGRAMDQLAPLKKKFIQKRSEELLFSKGGYDAASALKQAEKEWNDYASNGGKVKNSPVSRILDSDLRNEAGITPSTGQPGRPAASSPVVTAEGSGAFLGEGTTSGVPNWDKGATPAASTDQGAPTGPNTATAVNSAPLPTPPVPAGSGPAPIAPTPAVTTGRSSPILAGESYSPTPYETPGAQAAKVAAIVTQMKESTPDAGGVGGAPGTVGPQNLRTVPMFVDNLNLVLFNTGSVR